MTRKHFKIHGLDKVLEDVPADQRSNLVEEIVTELSHFDPKEPPGERVPFVTAGTRVCPNCKGELSELGVIPTPQGETVCILECESCDGTFCENTATSVQ